MIDNNKLFIDKELRMYYKNQNELISIVIPTYNLSKHIETTILSLLNQTYKDIEIVIIDDNSSDDTTKIITPLEKENKNITYIKLSKNKGVSNARNVGLQKSSGKYILFLDADDWIESNYISIMLTEILKENSDIAIGSVKNEYNNFISSNMRYFYATTMSINAEYALKLLSRSIQNNFYITPMVGSKLFKKEFIVKNNLSFFGKNYEDDIFTFISFTMNPKIVIVSNAIQHYRQNYNSLTHTFDISKIDDLITAFQEIKKILIEQKKYRKFKHEYSSFFEKCFLSTYSSMVEMKMSDKEKKEYIYYFLSKVGKVSHIKDIVEYIDIQRIEKFIGVI